jgi:hypothetical protein
LLEKGIQRHRESMRDRVGKQTQRLLEKVIQILRVDKGDR